MTKGQNEQGGWQEGGEFATDKDIARRGVAVRAAALLPSDALDEGCRMLLDFAKVPRAKGQPSRRAVALLEKVRDDPPGSGRRPDILPR